MSIKDNKPELLNKRKLNYHLNPKGDDGKQPSVRDNQGKIVEYTNSQRMTDEVSVVDIGDSPNSQTGDPLRTAFIKLNNIVEALYWTSEGIDSELTRLEERGRFLGVLTYDQLPGGADSETRSIGEDSLGNIAVIAEDVEVVDSNNDSEAAWEIEFPDIDFSTVSNYNGRYRIPKGSLLSWQIIEGGNNDDRKWQVIYTNFAENQAFNFGDALAKYAEGTADTSLTSNSQKELYEEYNNTKAAKNSSNDIKARNVNDAIVEMHMRFSRRGLDSGYYG